MTCDRTLQCDHGVRRAGGPTDCQSGADDPEGSRRRDVPYKQTMFRLFRPPARRYWLVEHPDRLGYELVSDPLLEVMDAEDWYALEAAAADAE